LHCFLVRNGHFADFEFLTAGTDEALIEQAKRVFHELRPDRPFDGFEIWDGTRRVHVHCEEGGRSGLSADPQSSVPILKDRPFLAILLSLVLLLAAALWQFQSLMWG
jgi:hypothetical protein